MLIDIMNDHGLEQLVHSPAREKKHIGFNTHFSLFCQFRDIHSLDKSSDHDIVSGTLKVISLPIKKPRRNVIFVSEGDYETMRKDALGFAKEKYFNGHSDTRSVQENFDLITSFIRMNTFHKKVALFPRSHGSSKLRSKFETLRREIKADVRKQHDLHVKDLVGDVKAAPRDFYRYINSQKKDTQGIPPLKKRSGNGVAQSDLEKAEEFNGQFMDVFSKNEHSLSPLLDRSAFFMDDVIVSKDRVTKLSFGFIFFVMVHFIY